MKKFFLVILLATLSVTIKAQLVFKTLVTPGPVIAGEPFQVQYVLENLDKEDEFFPPDFQGFRFISGPNVYVGSAYGIDGASKLKNIVYTLVAPRAGKFMIPGAAARVGDNYIKSKNAAIEVLSKSNAVNRGLQPDYAEPNEDYFLAPGEDPYEKMRRNLFMKVAVDKKICFVGEPVTAVFKLYSRLESKSDIIKNPGFYGFTVQDMIGLNNKIMTTETVGGKKFDVHVVRKVQLYPLQAGLFTIDPMEVKNKVEFSKSAVYKKTEQEIIEGVVPEDGSMPNTNTMVYENNMSTGAVAITVKPTPQKNKPADYNGATGKFSIEADVEKRELGKNEEADLTITLSGKGNFTQVSAPVFDWPSGVEGFEPVIRDSLSHENSPLAGKREFHFRFASARPGNYQLPAISFSYFNPDSNSYTTISTGPISITISNQEKKMIAERIKNLLPADGRGYTKWLLLLLLIPAAVLFFRARQKNRIKTGATIMTQEANPSIINISALLQPALVLQEAGDEMFYQTLRTSIWKFFEAQFELHGSKANKANLLQKMAEYKMTLDEQKELLDILNECETGIFINADTAGMNKINLLERTKQSLERINRHLS